MAPETRVIMHLSFTRLSKKDLMQKVGSDGFFGKFDPDRLSEYVMEVVSIHRFSSVIKLSSGRSDHFVLPLTGAGVVKQIDRGEVT